MGIFDKPVTIIGRAVVMFHTCFDLAYGRVRIFAMILAVTLVAGTLSSSAAVAEDRVYVDLVRDDDPLQPVDTMFIGGTYSYRVWIENDARLTGIDLFFRISVSGDASWVFPDIEGFHTNYSDSDFVSGILGSRWMMYSAPDGSCWDLTGTLVDYYATGPMSNQFEIWGAAFMDGLTPGPLEPMLQIHIRPGGTWSDSIIGTICIDAMPSSSPDPSQFTPGGIPIFDLPRCYPMRVVCGDPNGDGSVNITDAVFMINYIFKGGPSPDPWQLGDANLDGGLNVGDAIYLVQAAFGIGPMPECPDVPPTQPLMAPHTPPAEKQL